MRRGETDIKIEVIFAQSTGRDFNIHVWRKATVAVNRKIRSNKRRRALKGGKGKVFHSDSF